MHPYGHTCMKHHYTHKCKIILFPSLSSWGCPRGIALVKELNKAVAGEGFLQTYSQGVGSTGATMLPLPFLPGTWSDAGDDAGQVSGEGRSPSLLASQSHRATLGQPGIWGKLNREFFEPLVSCVFCHLEPNAILFERLRSKLCLPLSSPSNLGLAIHLWARETGLAPIQQPHGSWRLAQQCCPSQQGQQCGVGGSESQKMWGSLEFLQWGEEKSPRESGRREWGIPQMWRRWEQSLGLQARNKMQRWSKCSLIQSESAQGDFQKMSVLSFWPRVEQTHSRDRSLK